MTSKLVAGNSLNNLFSDEKIDTKKLIFFGLTCPADCKFYIATVKNDDV